MGPSWDLTYDLVLPWSILGILSSVWTDSAIYFLLFTFSLFAHSQLFHAFLLLLMF